MGVERRSLTYVELDVPWCDRTYGVAPCTASLGVTGDKKCFNTLATCQDIANYTASIVTLRFAEPSMQRPTSHPHALDMIAPGGVTYESGTVAPGEGVGLRATIRVRFLDRPHSDTGDGFDKYRADRAYDPYQQGTFWPKFRSRYPYLVGSEIRLVRGTTEDAYADMEVRTFIVTDFTPMGSNGFEIEAHDILRLVDRIQSQAPLQSEGFLAAAVTSADTVLELSPTGIGADYPQEGYANVGGEEIVKYARASSTLVDSNTELLLLFDGTDGATTMTDSSGKGRNGTAVGNAQLDTADSRSGSASLLLDGTGDYVTVADNAAWTFSGVNFIVECWIRPTNLSATRPIFTHFTDANNYYRLQVSTTGVITFSLVSGGVTLVTMSSSAGAIVADVWQHVAASRGNTTWRIFVNGVQVATVTDVDVIPNFTGAFRIGTDQSATNFFLGHVDVFRIQSGAAYTATFTPAVYYADSADKMLVVRGQFNTVADAREAQDKVQLCLYYDAQDVADIIYDLLVTYCGVDPTYIPLTEWQAETAANLQVLYSRLIGEPTSVKKLLEDLIQQAAIALWWDDVDATLQLQVMRAIVTTSFSMTESNMMTFSMHEQPDKRIQQVWTHYGKINPLESDDKPENFRSVAVTFLATNYPQPAIKKIFASWIPEFGRSIALRVNDIMLARYGDPPRIFETTLLRRGIESPEMGQGATLQNAEYLQDDEGLAETVNVQILKCQADDATYKIKAIESFFTEILGTTDRYIYVETDTYNFNVRTVHDGLYPTPQSGDNVIVVVESGVIVGSTSVSTPAMDLGSWPAGVTITVDVTGRIQGKGGDGGGERMPSHNGVAGGTALTTTVAITLTGTGEVWGGGGGGGAGTSEYYGGGGGAGYNPGAGGLGNLVGGGNGSAGTTEAGGAGYVFSGSAYGGNGGGPGLAGANGASGALAGIGGAAGNAVDGDSLVTEIGTLDVRGGRIN